VSADVQLTGPDFASGVPLSGIPDGGMLAGHALGRPVLLARHGDELFAVGGSCTHYSGPLAEGLLVGTTVRCPWHHACFDVRSGVALKAPALNPLPRFDVERRGDSVFVTGESAAIGPSADPGLDKAALTQAIVIVGGGAAGDAAADMLRRQGHTGSLTVIGADEAPPVDRPNLSKDYLAGNAPEDWIPLRAPTFYRERGISLVTGRRVTRIDRAAHRVLLDDGASHGYDKLLLATGAAPIMLRDHPAGGAVHYLRTLADSRAIIAAAAGARSAVVIGASFIGLEVAASLRTRGLDVHVVAPEEHPLERVMGRAVSDFIRGVHESHGVRFHLGRSVQQADRQGVTLDDGQRIAADLIVAGIGVRPNDELANDAGLVVDKGIVVDGFLATSDPAIYAAGDVARYPDSRTGAAIRVEHWVVAQRQGQTAARNLLGAHRRFDDVPFFWSQHYDAVINYVGHAERWDEIQLSGNLADRDCTVIYTLEGKTLAVVTVGRDRANLDAELALERAASLTVGA
jgi:NADPH-dependent 2,4-dienoyl-CoA reductase/sulfur reductase-like enzyme/nitrite reductase/ring-hydroxylating ferredoxin subunit